MPLITTKQESKKDKLTVEIHTDVLDEIHNYCKWAKVDVDLFLEEAAKFIFKKDKEYKTQFKAKSNRGRKTTKKTEHI